MRYLYWKLYSGSLKVSFFDKANLHADHRSLVTNTTEFRTVMECIEVGLAVVIKVIAVRYVVHTRVY